MTREEVKQEFITKQPSINECESCPNKGIRLWKCAELHGCKWAQAMMEIAKMLESEPCEEKRTEERTKKHACDCISREAVIDRINKLIEVEKKQGTDDWGYGRERVNAYEAMLHFVKSEYLYPSVEPERKTGKWEYVQYDGNPKIGNWHCSECRSIVLGFEYTGFYNYCPWCGAPMEEDLV